jgi:predicted dehydrogenase
MQHVNVGLIGAGFVGKLHSVAYAAMPMFFWPPPAMPVRKMIADATEDLAREAALRFGFERYTGDWRRLVEDPEIQVVDIATPNNLHAEMAIAAAEAGKHILCEKPLGRNAAEAKRMLDAVEGAGVVHLVGHQYRRTPAVAFAKKLIDEGAIGPIVSYRGVYLQDFGVDRNVPLAWRFRKSEAGSGALGDIGSHALDMARYLAGEITAVNAVVRTLVPERPLPRPGQGMLSVSPTERAAGRPMGTVDVDDEVNTLLRFASGAVGSLEASRNAPGRHNQIGFEIHGERGSIAFNFERLDEIQAFFPDDPPDRRGFRTIYTGPAHPYGEYWPLTAAGLGYTDIKTLEVYDFIKAVAEGTSVSPNFRDGYRLAQVCDAILEAAERQGWVEL